MIELMLGVLLAAGAVWFVLRPIFHPPLAGRVGGEAGRVDDGDDPDDDLSPRAVALRALKEIEFDRATGKLSDVDYETLRAKYTARALAALRAEQREPRGATAPPLPVSRFPSPVCPTCGPRPEHDALFCSSCGRRLGVAPGYCARCGAALQTDACYCNACGARVAA